MVESRKGRTEERLDCNGVDRSRMTSAFSPLQQREGPFYLPFLSPPSFALFFPPTTLS